MGCIASSKNEVYKGKIKNGLSKLISCLESNLVSIGEELEKELIRELLYLRTRFEILDRRQLRGLITYGEYSAQENQILRAVIELLSDIDEVEKKNRTPKNEVRATVELTIDRDYYKYTNKDLTELSNAIANLVIATQGKIIINDIRDGSVIVQIITPLSKAIELEKYIKDGQLKEYDIVECKVEIGNSFKSFLGNIYYLLGDLHHSIGDLEDAIELYKRAAKKFEEDFLEEESSNMYQRAGKLAHENNDYENALWLTRESLRILYRTEDVEGQAIGLAQLGLLYFDRSEYEKALKNTETALKIFQQLNSVKNVLNAISLIGTIHLREENFERALSEFSKMLDFARANNDTYHIAYANYLMGSGLIQINRFSRAKDYNDEALRLYEIINDQMGVSNSLHQAGIILRKQNSFEEALFLYAEAYEISLKMYRQSPTRSLLEGIGNTFAEVGRLKMLTLDLESSLYFLLKAHKIFTVIENNPMGFTETWIQGLKAQLDKETVDYFLTLTEGQHLEDLYHDNIEKFFDVLIGEEKVKNIRLRVVNEEQTTLSFAIAA